MPRLMGSVLAAVLLAALGQGCSRSDPPPTDVALASERPAKAEKESKKTGKKEEETPNTPEAAARACKSDTERKGIGSVIGILSRFRKGAAEEDYRACMKARGFEVKS